MSCPPAASVSCCVTGVLEAAYANLSTPAPSPNTPPGNLGISPTQLDPYAICRANILASLPQVRPLKGLTAELWAIHGLLLVIMLLGIASVAWRWWKKGRSSVWLIRRMVTARGSYFVPNPSALFLVPLLLWAISGHVVTRIMRETLVAGDFRMAAEGLFFFVLCILFLWLAGFVQGAALLFSVSDFLLPRGSSHSMRLASTATPLSVQDLSPRALNAVLIGAPSLMFVLGLTGASLATAWQQQTSSAAFDVAGGLNTLSEEYASSNANTLPSTTHLDARLFVGTHTLFLERHAITATFATIVVFDLIFLSLYGRFAWAVVSVIRKQRVLLRDPSNHFVGSLSSRRPTHDQDRNWSRMESSVELERQAEAAPAGGGAEQPDRPPSSSGRDRQAGIAEERAVRRKRLSIAYFSIVGLAVAMLFIASVDVGFLTWGATSQSFSAFRRLVPAALYTWCITCLFAVGLLAWQSFSSYAPGTPPPALSAPNAPPDPNQDFYYGNRDDEELGDKVRASLASEAGTARASVVPVLPSDGSDPLNVHRDGGRGVTLPPAARTDSDRSSSDPSSKDRKPPKRESSFASSVRSQPWAPSQHFRAALEPARGKEEEEDEDDDASLRY